MSQSTIEHRYASALMRISGNDLKAAQKLMTQLQPVLELFELEDSAKVLRSLVMPKELKVELLKYALGKSGRSEALEQFVETIVEAQRTALLPGIIAAFEDTVNEQLGIFRCDLTTAVEVGKKDVQAIADLVKSKKKCSDVIITQKVEPDLLGGFVLQIGNAVLDLSIKSKLDLVARTE